MKMTTSFEQKKKVLIVAGETSGEAHAAALVHALNHGSSKGLDFYGSGGKNMADENVELLLDVSSLAAIGPVAAARNLGSYLKLYRKIIQRVDQNRPDLAILVDFPDFNLPLAGRLKVRKVPVVYFISPQIWAWRQSRVKHIRRNVDLMLVILPFEEEFYRAHDIRARYVGNPSATRFRKHLAAAKEEDQPGEMVALLPGSRKKEVELILPVQLDSALYLTEKRPMKCVLVKAPDVDDHFLNSVVDVWRKKTGSQMKVEIRENSWQVFRQATCAVVKSGTSTLEAMLAEVPFAMVYRISASSYFLLKPWVKTDTYCLPNLIAGSDIVPEFVQQEARGELIGQHLLRILNDSRAVSKMKLSLRQTARKLGEIDTGQEAARIIQEKYFH